MAQLFWYSFGMKKDSLYYETVPVFMQYLTSLSAILQKGAKFAAQKKNKTSEKKLLEDKLAPDMYNLIQQVGYSYYSALEAVQNLTGKPMIELGYDEKSFKELQSSIKKVITHLENVRPKDMEFSKGKKIKSFILTDMAVSRETYVRQYILPNFYFHVTTAYDILRHNGVQIGKDDYLGLQ